MAVSENDLIVGPLTPAAGVTTISLDFYFEQASWLEVYKSGSETPLVFNTDYTVTGAGTGSGVVTLAVAANGTDAYSVYLIVPLQRSSDMQLRGEFKSDPFNIEMDRIWQAIQGINTRVAQSLRISRTSLVVGPLATGSAAARAGRALVFGASGSDLGIGPTAAEIASAQSFAASAGTSATEAGDSAAEAADSAAEAAASAASVTGTPTPYDFDASPTGTAAANDASFAALAAAYPTTTIDLEGLSWPVTSIPSVIAQHGFWEIANAVGALTVRYPADRTFDIAEIGLTHGICNSAWPQDNADVWKGEIFCANTESNRHTNQPDPTQRPVIHRSRDGYSWEREEVDLGFPCSVWGHTVFGGMQLIAVRSEASGATNKDFSLWSRQLAQRIEMNEISSQGASDERFDVVFRDLTFPVVLKEGTVVHFNGVSTFAGQNVNGARTVNFVNSTRAEFRADGDFTSEATLTDIFEINVLEGTWTEVKFQGDISLGEACAAEESGSDHPNIIQGLRVDEDGRRPGENMGAAGGGIYYFGCSGTQWNVSIGKIRDVADVNNFAKLEWLKEVSGMSGKNTEPTILSFPTGKLAGFARTQDENAGQTAGAKFFTSTDDGDNWTTTSLPLGAFEQSPIPLTNIGDYLVGCGTVERMGDAAYGDRSVVLLVATIADAFSTGATAFQSYEIAQAKYENQTLSGGATGTGTPSIVELDGNTLVAFWTNEVSTRAPGAAWEGDSDNVTQLMAAKINIAALVGGKKPQIRAINWGAPAPLAWSVALVGNDQAANGADIVWRTVEHSNAPNTYDTSNGKIGIPVTGRYRISVQVEYDSGDTYRYLRVKNHRTNAFIGTRHLAAVNVASGDDALGAVTFEFLAVAGDQITVVPSASGGVIDTNVKSFVDLTYVGGS